MAELTFTHNQALLSGGGNRNWEQEQNKRSQHQQASVSYLRVPSLQPKIQLKRPETDFWLFANYVFYFFFMHVHIPIYATPCIWGPGDNLQESVLFLQRGGSQGWVSGLQPGQLVPILNEPSRCCPPLPHFQNSSAILWAAFASGVFVTLSCWAIGMAFESAKCIFLKTGNLNAEYSWPQGFQSSTVPLDSHSCLMRTVQTM